MAELDAVVKGLNIAVMWKLERVEICTDSVSVEHRVRNVLSAENRIKTKGHS